VQGGGGDLESGGEAEDDAGQYGRQQTEGQDRDIGVDVAEKRDAESLKVRQDIRSARGENHAQQGAATRERDALGQHLADQPPPSRAERRADGNLLLPRRSPRQ